MRSLCCVAVVKGVGMVGNPTPYMPCLRMPAQAAKMVVGPETALGNMRLHSRCRAGQV